ncbi:hypothetical protein SAMN05421803_111101 [Nocardiopsis flavescens]|uniref:NERD domain-containing protein n=1 Tax=Nocardiopsis flavescens TaxID=758803 RepID=A0A1M6N803_9ACTN|nr:hypothetical protein [Nocardiopsis flavescens]SHJ91764.1 hypothetical protein SAMN05421803_111101 [Nocardiopsis flavescens]
MPVEVQVDGSFFTFSDGWELEKLDEWPAQKLATQAPFHSKGCDLVALKDGELWLIEAKDYTYPGARVPDDLTDKVGLKFFHSLALLHVVARWGEGSHREYSLKALACRRARVCLAVELPDGGRRLIGVATPLAGLQDKLKRVTRKLRIHHPVVSNSHRTNGVPWEVRRDPGTRGRHSDR